MAHPQQLQFVKTVSALLSNDTSMSKIIEIGSYDVNGSIRAMFKTPNYLGVDLTQGPGVDLVCGGDAVDHPDQTYDIALSCECFEHNPKWVETFSNMHRLTKAGGLLLVTCASTGRPEHGTTRTSPQESPGTQSINWDYYQNLEEQDFHKHFDLNAMFSCFFFLRHQPSHDLYFLGFKSGAPRAHEITWKQLQSACQSDLLDLEKIIERKEKMRKITPKILRGLFNFGKNSPEQKKNPRLLSSI